MNRGYIVKVLPLLMLLLLAGCGETYRDPSGNEISKEEHDRRVANDAAHDAMINLINECKASPHDGCPIIKGN